MFKRYTYVEGLTNLDNNEEGILINILGQIKDKYGNDLTITRDAQDHKVVNVQSWDGKRDYRVIDLVALQFKSLKIPKESFGKVIAFVIDGNKNNTHAVNIGYRFEGGKLEVAGYPGFYHIPSCTAFGINEEGDLLTISTGTHTRKWQVTPANKDTNSKGGYYVTTAWFSKARTIGLFRHRALCLVFKDYPDNVDKMTVNHKNGVPGDDWLDNLEWVTRGQNNLHAYVNDLKNQHKRVLCRDVRTGEVVEYYSISECSRVLGYASDETIRFRLYKSKFSQVFEDGKQFKLKNDTRDWIIPRDSEAAIKTAMQKIPVKVRNCSNLIEINYPTIIDAGFATGIKSGTIQWRLSRNDDSPLFGYQFKYFNDSTIWSNFTKQNLQDSLVPNSFSVDCRNYITGENISFDSVNLAVQYIGNNNIAILLRGGEQPLLSSGWHVKFTDQEWEEFDDFEKEMYKRTKDITAREESTGKIIIAASSRELSNQLKLDPKRIRSAAMTRGNKIYDGYRFRLGVSNDPWPTTILP